MHVEAVGLLRALVEHGAVAGISPESGRAHECVLIGVHRWTGCIAGLVGGSFCSFRRCLHLFRGRCVRSLGGCLLRRCIRSTSCCCCVLSLGGCLLRRCVRRCCCGLIRSRGILSLGCRLLGCGRLLCSGRLLSGRFLSCCCRLRSLRRSLDCCGRLLSCSRLLSLRGCVRSSCSFRWLRCGFRWLRCGFRCLSCCRFRCLSC